jgi:hypothetical protein
VWAEAKARFTSQVAGPHFEELCRQFAASAPADLFGGLPAQVGSGVVSDPARRSQLEIDVVVLGPAEPEVPRRVLSLGEAKWGKTLGIRHIERLRRARELLGDRGFDVRDTVLACYSRNGFEPGVHEAPDRVLTISLEDLYRE